MTPLHIAALYNHYRVCEVLLDFGGNLEVNARDGSARTPLHLACQTGSLEVVKLLVRANGSFSLPDEYGNTPVHYAIENGEIELVRWLLKKHPDLEVRNKQGKTPVEMAENLRLFTACSPRPENPAERVVPVKKSPYMKNREIKNVKRLELEELGKASLDDFYVIQALGRGSFSSVFLVGKHSGSELYAMKVMKKSRVLQYSTTRYVLTERNILSHIDHPFVVKLKFAFQTDSDLILILDYCPGGDLSSLIAREKRLPEHIAKLYLAEITLAIEELHRNGVIYRDLKPSNIVIDAEGHALITDFGSSKQGTEETYSFCGSPAYLPPEIIKRTGHSCAVDWYLLGVLLYEMLTGTLPFFSHDKRTLFSNITKGKLHIPKDVSPEAAELLQALLQKDPAKRLCTAESVKAQVFFLGTDWDLVYTRGLEPPVPRTPSVSHSAPSSLTSCCSLSPTHLAGWSYLPGSLNG